jgi:hypothetical protein
MQQQLVMVRCPHSIIGCHWHGLTTHELEQHLRMCAFEQMKDYINEKEKQIKVDLCDLCTHSQMIRCDLCVSHRQLLP